MVYEFYCKRGYRVLIILEKTPLWVFILFGLLCVLGYVQSKDRTLGYQRALIIPYVLFLFSLYGVISSFGVGISLLFWVVAMGGGIVLGLKMSVTHAMVYLPQRHAFIIKGSWVWLGVIMTLFFIKYTVGVLLAREVLLAQTFIFEASVSAVYGLFSGFFFARVIVLKRLHVKHTKVKVEE